MQKINKAFLREYIRADMRADFALGFSLRIILLSIPEGVSLRILRNKNDIRSALKTSLVVHLQLLRVKVDDQSQTSSIQNVASTGSAVTCPTKQLSQFILAIL